MEGEPAEGGRGYVLIETKWGRENGLGPFPVEEEFVFRGFFGRDVETGRVARYRFFLAPYRRDGTPSPRRSYGGRCCGGATSATRRCNGP